VGPRGLNFGIAAESRSERKCQDGAVRRLILLLDGGLGSPWEGEDSKPIDRRMDLRLATSIFRFQIKLRVIIELLVHSSSD